MLSGKGEFADAPHDIPVRGWRDTFRRTWAEAGRDHIGLIAAGVAFFGLLALFPAITVVMAISGLMLEPEQVTSQIERLASILPERAADIILDQAVEIAGSQATGLGAAALIGFILAIWSASKGVSSLIEGLNIVYEEEETRGLVRLTALRLLLTVGLIAGVVFGFAVMVGIPGLLALVDLGAATELLVRVARWVVLVVLAILGIAALYRFAPARSPALWRWITPGAILACIGWIAASIGFSWYASAFGTYNESFGALAGVVMLLMWFWISAYVLLLGAELNAESEAQTRSDTTTGPERPRGTRGATKADEFAG